MVSQRTGLSDVLVAYYVILRHFHIEFIMFLYLAVVQNASYLVSIDVAKNQVIQSELYFLARFLLELKFQALRCDFQWLKIDSKLSL